MFTASHNGPEDNGVKIVEKDGSMLPQDWEQWAEWIINSEDLRTSLLNLNEISLRGMPLGFDIFDCQPMPKKEVGAENLD